MLSKENPGIKIYAYRQSRLVNMDARPTEIDDVSNKGRNWVVPEEEIRRLGPLQCLVG